MGEALITRRGGGANLNFRVNQYPAITDLSQFAGKENEIAVLTDTPIRSWVFNTQEPEAPHENDVWIKTAGLSNISFNALKKNGIFQYLHGVYQYESGAWVKKDAAIYQNGAWHRFEIWLYNRGDQCESETGGWTAVTYYFSVTFYDDRIYATNTANGGYGTIYTVDKVDLHGKTKLCARVKYYAAGTSSANFFGLCTVNTAWSPTYLAKTAFDSADEKLYELDISAYKNRTDCYIGITMVRGTVYEVWLE